MNKWWFAFAMGWFGALFFLVVVDAVVNGVCHDIKGSILFPTMQVKPQ